MYDFCVVGNGAVGLMSAYELALNFPNKKIAVVGPRDQRGSASKAAGAMHAVFAEIEAHFDSSKGDQLQFKLALESKQYWMRFFEYFGESALTAKDTILYLKNTDNPFEIANYEAATRIAGQYQALRNATAREISEYTNLATYEDVTVIKQEFAFCPITVCEQLLSFLESHPNCTVIDDIATAIDGDSIVLSGLGKILSHQTIVANGAASNGLLEKFGSIPVYQGVGTALVVDSKTITFGSEYVVRTVNRGGAQCGLHVVPRANGTHYIGAGNYLAAYDDRSDHRMETVRYLTSVAKADILGDSNVYNMRGTLTLGKRPRSLDGWPLFGRLRAHSNIIVATGWNRVGLSLSPLIAREIVAVIKESGESLMNEWRPDRDPISFGTLDECAAFFAESRCANLIEHKLLRPNSTDYKLKYDELVKISKKYNNAITKNLGVDSHFGIHPDLYGVLGP